MHGTTAATNAVLEGKGARTALIVTEGFRDVLHIMRQNRPELYDFFAKRPLPLVPRHLRFEVSERILYTGEIFKEIDEKKLKTIIRKIKHQKVESIAICLLHSYVNPIHEQKIKKVLLQECPEIFVCASSEILPEIKEYDRMSTTVINAYVLPIVESYLTDLSKRLADIGTERTVHIMQSNGGIMPSSLAAKKSATTILSGPAAGVLGGVFLARQAGFKDIITVDMGGTSFDICLAYRGKPKVAYGTEIGGHALKLPMIDIHTIGAGGGSIAWIDRGGVLKVGPRSAGANPGPACYNKGGLEPTVTDANLVLDRLNAEYFLGGEMKVNKEAARVAIEKKLARPLGMSTHEVAEGIIRVVNASMVKGIRFVSVEKGYDPREFSLVCFGGSGPVHAVELAEELAIPQVIIPFAPGITCAYGLLMADFRSDYGKTYLKKMDELSLKEINTIYGKLEKSARTMMEGERFSRENIIIVRSVEMRYLGQGYELEVPIDSGKITNRILGSVRRAFDTLHQQNYGFCKPDDPTEIVNLRIVCFGRLTKPELRKKRPAKSNPEGALKGKRNVFMKGRLRNTSIYDREMLNSGNVVSGPAIIEQKDSTTILFPGNIGRVDVYGNIIIKIK